MPNTMQDFFRIEAENETLRSELLEIQSNFTAQERQFLEINNQKAVAETEYSAYRTKAQSEIGELIEQVRDKEIELARIQDQIDRARNPRDDDEGTRLKNQLENLTDRFEEEKTHTEDYIKNQATDIDTMQK